MPFAPVGLSEILIEELNGFLTGNDFSDLYVSYNWRNDNYDDGFPDILKIENALVASDSNEGISLGDVRRVADWGKLRNPGRIQGKEIVLPPRTLHDVNINPPENLALRPLRPLLLLEGNVEKGVGPTYLSKVLRFGLPVEYGAIDTRCVRVFGKGDPLSQRHRWLDLKARNDGYGWYIPKTQGAWPSSYGTWLNILRYFSQRLPRNCPHPEAFMRCGLRLNNEWACADVEMALFTYASRFTT